MLVYFPLALKHPLGVYNSLLAVFDATQWTAEFRDEVDLCRLGIGGRAKSL